MPSRQKTKSKSLGLNTGNLRAMLAGLKDNDQLEVVLCAKSPCTSADSHEKLSALCYRLYNLLAHACECANHDAKLEKKSRMHTIYYEKDGCNQGASALLEDIEHELSNYSKEMIQIDLERSL